MTGAEILEALEADDTERRERARRVAELREAVVAASDLQRALRLAVSPRREIANPAGWLVFTAVRDGLAVDAEALASSLRASPHPEGLLQAARALTVRGALHPTVVAAVQLHTVDNAAGPQGGSDPIQRRLY